MFVSNKDSSQSLDIPAVLTASANTTDLAVNVRIFLIKDRE
jgi:hypothetical protein